MSKVNAKKIIIFLLLSIFLLFLIAIDLLRPWSFISKTKRSLSGMEYEICTVEDCCNPITSSNYGRYLCRPKVCNIAG